MRRALPSLLFIAVMWANGACTDTSFSGSGNSKSTQRRESAKPKKPASSDATSDTDQPLGNTEAGTQAGTNAENTVDNGGVVTPDLDSGDVVTPNIDDLVITAQEGRSVQACFSYDAVKMAALVASGQAHHGHHCNRAVFNVFLSGTQVGSINLNNRNDNGPFPGGGGGGGFPGGHDGPSVMGGTFNGKWINGLFDVEIQCAIGNCHEDVTFLSIIGEVVTTSGKTMWLKIDQGVIYPNEKYAYKFAEFTLSDVKPSFGAYCQLQ